MLLEAYVLPVFFRRAAVVDAIVERGKRKEPSRVTSNRRSVN
jgi:hypothetical protein